MAGENPINWNVLVRCSPQQCGLTRRSMSRMSGKLLQRTEFLDAATTSGDLGELATSGYAEMKAIRASLVNGVRSFARATVRGCFSKHHSLLQPSVSKGVVVRQRLSFIAASLVWVRKRSATVDQLALAVLAEAAPSLGSPINCSRVERIFSEIPFNGSLKVAFLRVDCFVLAMELVRLGASRVWCLKTSKI